MAWNSSFDTGLTKSSVNGVFDGTTAAVVAAAAVAAADRGDRSANGLGAAAE